MTPQDQLTYAQARLDKATLAYDRALDSDQMVQSGHRRKESHGLADLLAAVKYWQGKVDQWDALVNGIARPHINPPLRPYL